MVHSNLQFTICEFKDTVVDRKDCTPALLWSKTTQTTGGVDGTWEDPPTCKMGTFFLMSFTLTEPSLNNFQLNGAKLF